MFTGAARDDDRVRFAPIEATFITRGNMSSTPQINKHVEAVDVTVNIKGLPIRALVTRQALEVLWQMPDVEPPPMLASFAAHRAEIESTIFAQYSRERKQPVIVHVHPN